MTPGPPRVRTRVPVNQIRPGVVGTGALTEAAFETTLASIQAEREAQRLQHDARDSGARCVGHGATVTATHRFCAALSRTARLPHKGTVSCAINMNNYYRVEYRGKDKRPKEFQGSCTRLEPIFAQVGSSLGIL